MNRNTDSENNTKLIRVTTVPGSLRGLLKGQLRFMSENGFEVIGISSSGEALKEVEKNEGVKIYAVEMTRRITPFKDLRAVYQLYKFFKKEKPDIVHTHTPKAGTLGMLAAWLARVPIRLHTVAGMPLLVAKGSKRKLLNFVEKLTYRWATKVYPNSFKMKDIILDGKYTSENKLRVIGNGSSNGINTTYFSSGNIPNDVIKELRNRFGVAQNDFVFIFMGRIVRDKGIVELVSAFKRFQERYPDARLLLVGTMESMLDPLPKEILDEIKTNEGIIEAGWQTDVRPWFAASDALLFPSYREGFPNVVMQAGAMGLPSVVTDINGCNEIIIEGENGYIIPVYDADALYERMLWLVENKERTERMARNARPLIESRYEQSAVWQALLEEYNLLLESK